MNFPYIYKNNPEYIYATSNDDKGVRYVLGKPARKNIICFGINPSTATPEKLDKTIQNVVKIAMRTKSGHPRHPSRVSHSCRLAEFEDFAKYMEQILSSK